MTAPPPRPPFGRRRSVRPRSVPAFRAAAVVVALLLGALAPMWATAHGGVVFGRLTATPNPPRVGDAVQLTLELEDAAGMPVEDAVLDVTVRGPSGASTDAVSLQEAGAGVYAATWRPSEAGVHRVTVVDRTFDDEDVAQTVELTVGADAPLAPRDMLFTPTDADDGVPLRTWIVWLVAVPAGVAVLVAGLSLAVRPTGDDPPGGGPETSESDPPS